VDVGRLRATWAKAAALGDAVPAFFYAVLFVAHPELRELFPVSMAAQRDRLFTALGRVISQVDNTDALVPYVAQLGRDHRRFDVRPEHYPAVGEALLTTLEHFLGDEWTPEVAADWQAAYGVLAQVMVDAAAKAASTTPPWWDAEIVAHERRTPEIAVMQIVPGQRYAFLPGQSFAAETAYRPRVWRYLSPANAPRDDGTIELHVRAVDGGGVSSALVHGAQPGDVLRMGAPVGTKLTLNDHARRDLLLIAGGTGLAPLRALIEQVAWEGGQRQVHLFVGAPTGRDLYDLPWLQLMATRYGWLNVVPAVSADAGYPGEHGNAVDVAMRRGRWDGHDVYVCGSAPMVAGTVERLTHAGADPALMHTEDFDSDLTPDVPAPAPAPSAVGLTDEGMR
jgi:NAD(P)H-flavin reductase/hemoglobin-like flavoprotein